MANPEHLAKLKEGVESWNQWRNQDLPDYWDSRVYVPDLSGSDLRKADLSEADFRQADLSGTDLSWANLRNANLSHARLDQVDFSFADLVAADLSGATFDHTDVTGARMHGTRLADVDLSTVKGLKLISHYGPSSIGIDTIYKSKGKIPHAFLRGAGVPENFIEYMASLVSTGIEFYSLFISYSHKDEEFAKRLHADLQAGGVRCWYAPEDMPGGKKLHEEIDAAIRMHDKLLLILSEHSMASKWVKTEMRRARKREIEEKRRVLFPICICPFETVSKWECFYADEGIDLAEEIREYFIPDFSNWENHKAYKHAFDRLLKDLQGKPDPPTAAQS